MSNILNKLLDKAKINNNGPMAADVKKADVKPGAAPNRNDSLDATKITSDMSHLSTTAPAAAPKPKLTDFTLMRTLGTGSFGRVHLVQRKTTGQYCAMKVMKKSEVVRLKQVEHTINEKKILEATNHPFLVNMIGSFQDCSNLYFVLEYVQGGELFSLLRRSQVLFYF